MFPSGVKAVYHKSKGWMKRIQERIWGIWIAIPEAMVEPGALTPFKEHIDEHFESNNRRLVDKY